MAVAEPENELSHSPRLFDWWCGNVASRCDRTPVRRIELGADINIDGDGRDWRRRRHQPNTWANANPTGFSVSRTTHRCAPARSRPSVKSRRVSATSTRNVVCHQRITSASLYAACNICASRSGSKGANNSRAVVSSTRSRLAAIRVEPEYAELAGQARELIGSAVAHQARAFGEPDADRHLDRECPQHGP
ncbi:MAG: hypothetical protein V7643_4413 [Mycobacterium sp.]